MISAETCSSLGCPFLKKKKPSVSPEVPSSPAGRDFLQDDYNWKKKARLSQLPPEGEWVGWVILAGRGFGKTRTGAETIRHWVTEGRCQRIALVGQTQADVRDVMIGGESGLLSVSPPAERPLYEPSKRLLTWPNGAIGMAYSGDRYNQLRGPQFDGAWIDELAKFREPESAWDHLMLGLRLGAYPRVVVTTTPTSHPFIQKLIDNPECVVTQGSTFENQDNLPDSFLKSIRRQYEGTPLEAQEIYAQILKESPHVLWRQEDIRLCPHLPSLRRIVVAVDPAVSLGKGSDETGIVVAGVDRGGVGYVLEDMSGQYSPPGWAFQAIQAYHRYQAHSLVVERNNGGQMVESVIKTMDSSVFIKTVWAKDNKYRRTLPIFMLYQQQRVFHKDKFKKLEDQMLNWGQQDQDDRLDALVWALTELCLEGQGGSSSPLPLPLVFR